MVTAGSVLNEIKSRFKNAGIENYTFESRCIVESALNLSHAALLAGPDKPVADEDEALIITMANRRLEGYPLQYIIGKWEFFGLPFFVGEGVDRAGIESRISEFKLEEQIRAPKNL